MEESLQVLIENAPGAGAVIAMAYLFLRDRKALVEQHYMTIASLFDKADQTNKAVLDQQRVQSELIGKTLIVNQEMSKSLANVAEGLEDVIRTTKDVIRDTKSEPKMDARAIRRAVEEIKQEIDSGG